MLTKVKDTVFVLFLFVVEDKRHNTAVGYSADKSESLKAK